VRLTSEKTFNATVLIAMVVAVFMMLATHLVLRQVRREEIQETAVIQGNALRVFWVLLRHKGSEFRIRDGRLMAGEYPVNGNNELPDQVKELTGSDATVFMADTRIATTIVQEQGRRALGTKLTGPVYDAIFRKGIPFRGEAKILGQTYFTAYDPIRDGSGNIIGVLFVGSSQKDYLAAFERTSIRMLAINGTLGFVFIFLAFLLLRERKRSEESIQKQLEFLQVIIDTIPCPVYYKDVRGRYLGFNKTFESFVGLPRERMLLKTANEVWSPELGDQFGEMDRMLFQDLGVQVYESSIRHADGKPREVIINKAPFMSADGAVGGLVGVMLDITLRKAAEKQRSMLEAQLHHSKLIESLMVQISHDLKTPLTPLFALLPIIRKKGCHPSVDRMLDICLSCVSQIQGLAGKALELVRLSDEVPAPELVPLALAQVAQDSVQGCAEALRQRGITCLNGIAADLVVAGAKEQLALLFDNLLSNAARFAAENGTVRIAAVAGKDEITVSVQDDGVGLEPGHEQLIFGEFFKADAARHDLSTQGLGLAICRRIMANHHGRIWAESPGRGMGTTIFFTLRPPAGEPRHG